VTDVDGVAPSPMPSCRRVHLPWPASDAGPYSRIDFRPEDISDRRGGANLCTSLTRRRWPTATARAYNEEVGVRLRRGKRYWLLGVAVLAPLLACLSMVPFRESFANTSAALVLVLVVVAVATAGDRLAGVLAACSAGLWFDFFLTQPYQRFAVTSGSPTGDADNMPEPPSGPATWRASNKSQPPRPLAHRRHQRSSTPSASRWQQS
jgi:hypothetical protein